MSKKLTTDEVINRFIEKHGDKYDYSLVSYINAKTKVNILCKTHDVFKQLPHSHMNGNGCPECGNISTGNKKSKPKNNSIFEMRPDLVKYLKYKEDAYKYSYASNKKVSIICPHCGKEKIKTVNKLSIYGICCDCTSGKFSIPEKFLFHILNDINLDFETQYTLIHDNFGRKYYDFYIKSLNLIIETHGGQHYNESGFTSRTLEEEQENDKIKYDLAIQSGIEPENYIVIDCRKSEFEFLKYNFLNSLNDFLNLNNIDWDKNWEIVQYFSISKDICEQWNNKMNHETTRDLSILNNLDRSTIIKYLKIGNELGWCVYNTKDEVSKSGSREKPTTWKRVYQYSIDGQLIKEWSKLTEAEKQLNIRSITRACDKNRTAGGFRWSYKKQDFLIIPFEKTINVTAIYQYSLTNEYIKKWNSITEASTKLNISRTHISSCASGKRNSCGGFKWRYNKV